MLGLRSSRSNILKLMDMQPISSQADTRFCVIRPRPSKIIVILTLVFSMVLTAAPGMPRFAVAYVLQGPQVLDLMVHKLDGAHTLRVQQRVTVEDRAVTPKPVELTETLSYLFPQQFRSDAWHEGTNRIQIVSYGQSLTVIDNKITAEHESRFDQYIDLLLYRSLKLLHETLLTHGVDVEITSLGRFDDRIAFVVGAQYPDDSVSQVWVDKELFLPLRWLSVYPAQNPSQAPQRLEFVYRDWQKHGDSWYPMQIESYQNNRLIRQVKVLHLEVNADFSADLMNIAYLKTVYAPPEPKAPQEKPPAELNEVQRTINEFRKKFEP